MEMNDPQHPVPDAREGEGVAVRHAAAAREKADPALGSKPVSLWIFLICSVILLLAGGYVGRLSGGFSFDQFTALGYVPEPPPGMEGVEMDLHWLDDVYMPLGKKRYSVCAGCHMNQGEGNPGANYPPLANSEWVTGNTEILAMIILNGLEGPITVQGKTYVNVMATQAAAVPTAEDLGAVMTFVRRSFGNDASIVTPEMAQKAMDIYQERQAAGKGAVTVEELLAKHDRMLPGGEVDPATGEPPVEDGATPEDGGEANAEQSSEDSQDGSEAETPAEQG